MRQIASLSFLPVGGHVKTFAGMMTNKVVSINVSSELPVFLSRERRRVVDRHDK
jgi:hypothetical protein